MSFGGNTAKPTITVLRWLISARGDLSSPVPGILTARDTGRPTGLCLRSSPGTVAPAARGEHLLGGRDFTAPPGERHPQGLQAAPSRPRGRHRPLSRAAGSSSRELSAHQEAPASWAPIYICSAGPRTPTQLGVTGRLCYERSRGPKCHSGQHAGDDRRSRGRNDYSLEASILR